MDDDSEGLGIRNWGCYYEPSVAKSNALGLELYSRDNVVDRDVKPFICGNGRELAAGVTYAGNGVRVGGVGYQHRDYGVGMSDGNINPQYGWMQQGSEKYVRMVPGTPNYSFLTECAANNFNHLSSHMSSAQLLDDEIEEGQIEGLDENENVNGNGKKKETSKKRPRGAPKVPKVKKPRKPRMPREENTHRVKAPIIKKSVGVVINGIDMDISGIPIPICSCTGVPQQCYRWGCGGWQSACCTTGMSMYPLPMSTKRRGARIAGRKMSLGAFKKVLEKLMGEGFNLSNPIDLRTHWAKHGTNKFVTIR